MASAAPAEVMAEECRAEFAAAFEKFDRRPKLVVDYDQRVLSRPQGVTHLGGEDRCDPQLAKEALERCRRILELRAQEFNAPAPPQLSAEQQLLAEQQAADEQRSVPSPATRLRLASRDAPDADLQSNQELAALYLGKQATPPESSKPADDPQAPATDSALAQILNALQLPSGSAPPP